MAPLDFVTLCSNQRTVSYQISPLLPEKRLRHITLEAKSHTGKSTQVPSGHPPSSFSMRKKANKQTNVNNKTAKIYQGLGGECTDASHNVTPQQRNILDT